MLNIFKTVKDDKAVFALNGRLDTTTASIFEQNVNTSLDGIKLLILDFENLEYISSAGLRVLVAAYKNMRKQGQMKLIHVRPSVLSVLEMTGFAEFLPIE